MSALDHLSMHSDGVTMTVEHDDPHWVTVARFDNQETGDAWRAVYRSIRLAENRPLFGPALELIGGAALRHREVVADESMMGYRAELSVYGLPPAEVR